MCWDFDSLEMSRELTLYESLVGNLPLQEFLVVFDTGSGNLFLPDRCRQGDQLPKAEPQESLVGKMIVLLDLFIPGYDTCSFPRNDMSRGESVDMKSKERLRNEFGLQFPVDEDASLQLFAFYSKYHSSLSNSIHPNWPVLHFLQFPRALRTCQSTSCMTKHRYDKLLSRAAKVGQQ